MSAGVLVQARMSSTRLPGKVLLHLAGRPVVEHLMQSLRRCKRPDLFAIITSSDPSDDPIQWYCHERSIPYFRGDLHDVASRFIQASEHLSVETIVRVTGDSPLLDHRLIDKALGIRAEESCDLVTNVHTRTFPVGQSVEVFSRDLLQHHAAHFRPIDQEHVTTYFHAHPELISIHNFQLDPPAPDLHLAIDLQEDITRLTQLYEEMDPPYWRYRVEEVIQIARRLGL